MAMTSRERISEYALMKTLGYRPLHVIGLIFGESLFIAGIGGLLGLLVSLPIRELVVTFAGAYFPVFNFSTLTIILAIIATIGVGILAAMFPAIKAVRTPIVNGLRVVE
jgi:putative ABC transport system permease protein